METEKLKFKIGLSGTHPEKQPHFRLSVDGIEQVIASISTKVDEIEYFEFEVNLDEGDHNFSIELLNKGVGDTVLDETGQILADMLLNIDSIEIDDIDLGSLKWTLSSYEPEYPTKHVASVFKQSGEHPPKMVKNCVNLGWNGKWTLPFQSPFYIWLLENM
jgi:hypothetical protein